VKFKVDENLPIELAEMLTLARHDALTVSGQSMQGIADLPLAHVCRQEGRILVTLDLDFADIRAYPPTEFPGFIVLRLGRQDKRHLLEVFRRVIPLVDREPPQKRLWIVEELCVRIVGESR